MRDEPSDSEENGSDNTNVPGIVSVTWELEITPFGRLASRGSSPGRELFAALTLRAALAGVTPLRYVPTGALNLVRVFTAESWSKKCFQEKPR